MTDRLEKIAADVIRASKADATEAIVSQHDSSLTRFAMNRVHQNVTEENTSVTVRAVSDNRIGVASGNDVSKSGLRNLAARALEVAKEQPRIADFPGLAPKRPLAQVGGYSREIDRITPARRTAAAMEIIGPAADEEAIASGTVSHFTGSIVVANSRGVDASARSSQFKATAVIEKESGSGYAARVSWTPRRVNVATVGQTALAKCLSSINPEAIEPDVYTVILEPQAVADVISYMAYAGLGAQAFLEGRSFVSKRMGEKLMSDSVSIWDDGLDATGIPQAFDYEGMPKQRVGLIEKGIAKGVVYDTYYASRAGILSTGHAMPPGFARGPLPTNLFMAAGENSIEEMVSSTDRGLLVTRFHYVNIADPSRAVLTGLTRDGTFLIENGQISKPVKNLRFTESIPAAFSTVEAISKERSLAPALLGAAVVPAVKLSRFTFSGVTEF